ncbi:unnamed protein product [Caenorhabditis bovis]|uniref:Uncharacterized protein n=1 Tax=Caenorhabditis bovis TaxID=2654633 RepID=A0A8S1EEP8_9PELO|nr:unnamed protein product [Caenorhabditis bovis]
MLPCEPSADYQSIIEITRYSTIFAIPVFGVSSYLLFYRSSTHWKPGRIHYARFMGINFASMVLLASGTCPILYLDISGLQVSGILRHFLNEEYSYAVIINIISFLFVSFALLQVIESKCDLIQKLFDETDLKPQQVLKIVRKIVYANLMAACFTILLIREFSEEQDDIKQRLEQQIVIFLAFIVTPLFVFLALRNEMGITAL